METIQNTPVHREEHREERVAWGWLVPAGLLAALVVAGVNAVVYLVAAAAETMPQVVVVNGQGPMTLSMVVATSVFGAVAGTIVYAVVGRFTRLPVRVFRVVAASVLVLSFVGPFTISGAPAAMVATLLLMHMVAAAVVVGLLTTLARRR